MGLSGVYVLLCAAHYAAHRPLSWTGEMPNKKLAVCCIFGRASEKFLTMSL